MKIDLKFCFIIFILSLFSVSINYFYGSLGVLPIDTFAHFDSGYRITEGDLPFVDYWTISGPFIDLLQAFYFSIFGVSWQSYMFNSSLINLLVTLTCFFYFKKIGLDIKYSFFYSVCVAILANPSMGTPFPDHYSTFLSLIAIIFFIFGIKTERTVYWFLIPVLFFLAFFCKQTPTAYIIIAFCINFLIYIIVKNRFNLVISIIGGSLLSLSFLIFFILYNNIDLSQFLNQYFYYPRTIGLRRITEWNLTFNKAVSTLKFIHLIFFILLVIFFKNIFFVKNYIKTDSFFINLNIILLSIFLILHQWLTLNFIFIFFLVPILCATTQTNLATSKFSKKLNILILCFCLLVTIKYHLRFNEERKMLDLENVNLTNYYNTGVLFPKLEGLKWISRKYYTNIKFEIDKLQSIKKILNSERKKIMFVSNYQFFSAILNKPLHSPNRWFGTSVAHPSINNSFYDDYLAFVYNVISKKRIEVIYIDVNLGKYQLDLFNKIRKKLPPDCSIMDEIEDVLYKIDISTCYH